MRVAMISATLFSMIGVWAASTESARACSCEAHFEVRYGSFKPDVPTDHFAAHQTRRPGETNNACRRRAREVAQSCMSALWRDRFLLQEKRFAEAAPECKKQLTELTDAIRPSVTASIDVKRQFERAACCGASPEKNSININVKIYKRTHGDNGCGPILQNAESRFLTDYHLDCTAIRARESCGAIAFSKSTAEEGYDRPGMDLRSFGATSPQKCRDACGDDNKCRSWTWVKAGIQGPTAKCWLKDGVPWAKKDDCCFSGTVR